MGEGTAVGPEGRRWWKDSLGGRKSLSAEPVSVAVLRSRLSAAQEVPNTQEGAFFFTKKAYCGNQTLCVAESRKSVQTHPPTPSALKNNGIPKGRVPLAGARGQSPRGLGSTQLRTSQAMVTWSPVRTRSRKEALRLLRVRIMFPWGFDRSTSTKFSISTNW
jgi:hypothetical protein